MNKLGSGKNSIVLFISMAILFGCSSPNTFYIDVTKQAIVSCKGEGFKNITVSDGNKEVSLEGTEPTVYFNQINSVSRTSIYDSIVYNYKLVLQPKSTYQIKADAGHDRASFTVKLTTDSLGKIISASNLKCN